MSNVLVLGANGALGRALVARLGADVDDAGAEVDSVEVRGVGHVDPDSPDDSLLAALDEATVVVDATGASGDERRAIGRAVVGAGCHLVDPTPAQPHVRWLVSDLAADARAANVAIVAGAGLVGGLGHLLAARAMEATRRPEHVHVAYLILDGGVLTRGTPGQRAAALSLLGAPGLAHVDGEPHPEWLGEARRLAWFARPVGPHHAAGVPGPEAILLPRRTPSLRTVRSYVALRTSRAELLQLVGNAARWAPARRRLRHLLSGMGREAGGPDGGARWAAVAEVEGADGVVRAWANGTGVHHTTAAIIELAVLELLQGSRHLAGVESLEAFAQPADLLDRIAPAADLRWSVIGPDEVLGG